METGASWFNVVLIFSRNKSHACKLSPIAFNDSFELAKARVFIGIIASSEWHKFITSRGETFPVATLEINRSKSDICLIWYWIFCKTSKLSFKKVTTSWRDWILTASFKGKANQRFNNREPIGESVLSITSNNVTALGLVLWYNSKFRIVKRSIHTYASSAIRWTDVICWILLCCVSDK